MLAKDSAEAEANTKTLTGTAAKDPTTKTCIQNPTRKPAKVPTEGNGSTKTLTERRGKGHAKTVASNKTPTEGRKQEKGGKVEKEIQEETVDGSRNLTNSEKKAQRSIRTNSDTRPHNKGAEHTRYHATTAQEDRHKPKDAKVLNERDKGDGIQQVPTTPEGRTNIHDNLPVYDADK